MDHQFLPPPPIHVPFLQGQMVSAPWNQWFTGQLYRRVGGSSGITADASEVTFDPSGSALTSTTVSAALKELDNSKQPLDATLTALAALGGTAGYLVQTGDDAFVKRVITGTTGNITVSYGDGSSGDTVVNLTTANSNPGTFGNAAYTLLASVDGFGRVTSLSATPILLSSSQVTGVALLASENTFTKLQTINLNTTGTPPATLTGTVLSVHNADNQTSRIGNTAWGLAGMACFAGRYSRGNMASPSAVQSGDCLSSFEGWGFDSASTEVSPAAFMRFYAAENHSATAHGSYASFWTIAKTTIVPTEKLRIYDDGGVRIGGTYTSSPGAGALTVNGAIAGSNLSGTNTGDVTLNAPSGLTLTGQAIAMGTPSSCTSATTNAVTTASHTHAITGFETSGSIAAHAALQTGVHGISITAAKTFTCTNSLTLSGTDGSTLNIGTGGTLNTAAYVADNTLVHLAGGEAITGSKVTTGGWYASTGGAVTATSVTFGNGDGVATAFCLISAYGWVVSPTITSITSSSTKLGTYTLLSTSRTNSCLQSQTMQTTWSPVHVSVSTDATTAPDGTTTADLITEDNQNTAHYMTQTGMTATSGVSSQMSVYIKPNGRTQFKIYFENDAFNSGANIVVTLTGAGTVNSTGTEGGATLSAYGVQALDNGWYRVYIVATIAYSSLRVNVYAYVSGSISYQGDNTSGFYMWGAQLEQSGLSTPGKYILTTTSPAAVTDYASDTNGQITLASAPISGAVLSWTGSGTLFPFSSGRSRQGGLTGFTEVEADGTIVMKGAATAWDDLFCPIVSGKTGASNAPTWSSFTTNLSAYTFAVNDCIEIGPIELKHDWKEGSQLEVHVHWATNGANDATARGVKWAVYYALANIEAQGGTIVFSEATLTQATDTTIAANEASLTNKYSTVGTITTTGFKIGSVLMLRLKRITATGTAPANNPFALMVGVHYEIDTIGSRTISAK